MFVKILKAAWLTLAASFGLAAPAVHAITNGELDGTRHPYVGLMVAQTAKGEPLWVLAAIRVIDWNARRDLVRRRRRALHPAERLPEQG